MIYGKELVSLGIILLALSILATIIFLSLHFFFAFRRKKELEKEYGERPGKT